MDFRTPARRILAPLKSIPSLFILGMKEDGFARRKAQPLSSFGALGELERRLSTRPRARRPARNRPGNPPHSGSPSLAISQTSRFTCFSE